ncbi:unnamed protein product, partial [Rotaria magnacalcarata]
HHEVDFYWNKVLSIVQINGYPKYPILSKLVKNIFIISHGNADVERGFSANANVLTEDRTLLSEKSINGLRAIYDGVEFLGPGSVHKVQVSTAMIRAVQKSAASYKEELLKMKALVASQQKESELLQTAELDKKKTNRRRTRAYDQV